MIDRPGTTWRRSTFCGDSSCVEVGQPVMYGDQIQVPVHKTEHPDRIECVPVDIWRGHVQAVKSGGQVPLTIWFPAELYGNFASLFTEDEEQAFLAGVKDGQFDFATS